MKNKVTLIIIIILIIIGASVLVKKAMAPGAPVDDSANQYASSTENSSTSVAMVNGQEVMATGFAPVTSNEKERKATVVFGCDDKKNIEGLVYVGGSNPRMEVSLIDYAEGVKGVPNEMRKFMLQQVPAEVNSRKYSTRDGSIVLTLKDQDETHLYENGREVFKNCHYLTSSFVE